MAIGRREGAWGTPSVAFMEERIGILVANRSRLVAEALVALFAELAGDAEISVAHTAEDAVRIAQGRQPRLVVLDAWIGGEPATVVRKVRALSPRSVVFVIATKSDSHLERRLTAAGAAGVHETESLPATVHSMLSELRTAP
jgi:DNA-binding NarL/FixJ family response regulator